LGHGVGGPPSAIIPGAAADADDDDDDDDDSSLAALDGLDAASLATGPEGMIPLTHQGKE